jgi:hypothetical protein
MARMNSGASRDRDRVMWLDAQVVMPRINRGASRHHGFSLNRSRTISE